MVEIVARNNNLYNDNDETELGVKITLVAQKEKKARHRKQLYPFFQKGNGDPGECLHQQLLVFSFP